MVNHNKPEPNKESNTNEINDILNHPPSSNLVVEAGAGTGKTTTLVKYTKKWNKRGLYISFNAAIAKEARGKFPSHIAVMTAHSYAYKALNVGKHRNRLVGKIRKHNIKNLPINIENQYLTEEKMLSMIITGIEKYTMDSGEEILPRHCEAQYFPKAVQEAVMPQIREAISLFINYENNSMPFTHDCYLKNLELYGQMGKEFDYILIDEAQDLNPVLLSLVSKANKPIIMVGDKYQSIYAFRGSIDAMAKFDAPRLPLSQSWRFGEKIGYIANNILGYTSKPPKINIKGRKDRITDIEIYKGKAEKKSLILSRTNVRLFEGLINIKVPFHVIGGFEIMAVQLLSALALSKGDRYNIKDQLVMSYRNWDEMVADSEEDMEIKRIVDIVRNYGHRLETIITDLRKLHSVNIKEATITLSTAHKAKGLEADNVIVLDDFPTPNELYARKKAKKISQIEYDQEFHLLYVSMTRALYKLSISEAMYNQFKKIIEA